MKWESLENKIKSALYGHKSKLDVDALWAAIEPGVDAINRKKKRKGMAWFWILGALLAGAGLGGYFYQQNYRSQIQPRPQEMPIAQTGKLGAEGALNDMHQTHGGVPVGHADTRQAKPNVQGGLENSTVASESLPSLAAKAKASGLNYQAPIPQKPIDNEIHSSSIQSQYSEAPLSGEQADDLEKMKTYNDMPLKQGKAEVLPLTTALPMLPLSVFDLPLAEVSVNNAWKNELDISPYNRHNPWRAAVYMQGSISFVERKLAAKDSVSLGLLKSRQKSERELEAYQAGLGFTLQHRSGLNFSTGINYTQINEQFRFNEMVVKTDSVYDIKYLVVNLNEDTVAIYGEVPIETKTTYQKEYYNKFRMIDVPLLIGYRHEGHTFSIGAQAGVFVNLSLATKGQFLKTPEETVDIENAGIFKSTIGLSYYFGLTAGYMVNENLEFYAAPFMRHYPKDFTNENYGLRQRYNLYGLTVGARYGF